MRLIDLLHRWLGGLVGLVLAVLGVSGALLAHKDVWVSAPGARDAQVQETAALAASVERMMADPADRPRAVIFATDSFGLNRLNFTDDAGAYARQSGEIVARWDSKWQRPEVWLFDLHHHLFYGETGEKAAGVVALIGLGFVITGLILWWPMRRSFELRPWPRKMSRFPILRHHRDWGVILAPILALVLTTGAIMVFRPVADLILGPGAAREITTALEAPKGPKAMLAARPDWRGMIETARRRFPDAEIRVLSLPRKGAGLVSLRVRQPGDWAPNGRTALWFAADTGRLLEVRDSRALSGRVQAYNAFYPLHAGKVGGLPYRLLVTFAGLSLGLFGLLTTWTFWFSRKRRRSPSRGARALSLGTS